MPVFLSKKEFGTEPSKALIVSNAKDDVSLTFKKKGKTAVELHLKLTFNIAENQGTLFIGDGEDVDSDGLAVFKLDGANFDQGFFNAISVAVPGPGAGDKPVRMHSSMNDFDITTNGIKRESGDKMHLTKRAVAKSEATKKTARKSNKTN